MKTSKNTSATLLERRAVKIGLSSFFCLVMALSSLAQPANKCLSFNGSTSIVNFADADLVLNWNNNLVVSAWVNWGSKANAGSNAVIMAVSDTTGNNNGQFWLQHNADNSRFQFIMQTDSLVKITVNSTTNPIAGNWYNVAGVFDGAQLKIYVNNNLEGSTTIPGGQVMNSPDSTFQMTLGASVDQTNHFNGLMDEVSIWNQPLVVNQSHPYTFQTYMCQSINIMAKGLYAYWNMDTLHTDSINDLVLDQDGGDEYNGVCSNITQLKGGAPLGNNATQLSGSGPFVYVNPANGDSLIISGADSISNGVYVYEVDGAPADSLLPSGVSTSCTSYYYGIFIPGYQGTDTVTYYYAATSCAGHRQSAASSPVLLNRNVQSSFNWAISNTSVDLLNSKFSVVLQGGQNEFILGSQANNTTNIANSINNSLKVTGINPNPFSTNFSITINCRKNTNIKARVISADGKFISESIRFCHIGENQLNFENMNEIASGVYFLNLSDGEGYTTNVKMIKN